MGHTVSLYDKLMEAAAVHTLVSLKVFDQLPEDISRTIALDQLSEACAIDPELLRRLLRLPARRGVVQMQSNGNIGHTTISLGYRTGCASAHLLQTVCDEAMRTALELPAWLRVADHRRGTQGTQTNTDNVFTFRDGSDGESMFSIMSRDPERASNFHRGLDALHGVFPHTGFFNLEHIVERPLSSDRLGSDCVTDQKLLVDVGGGSGTFLAKILEDHPGLSPTRVVLQDLPHVIDVARRNPQVPPGMCLQAHDFFTAQPVRNARAYHLRLCLHNHSDELCTQILQHLVDAMETPSKILISENIMPETLDVGVAGPLDMTMLLCGGTVRTLRQFDALFSRVGLAVKKVHKLAESTWAMMEVGTC